MARGSQKGTQKKDNWQGSNQNDIFNALGGNDICLGRGGKDQINGGAGDDDINGGAGADRINGGGGDDDIDGGAGGDVLLGGSGDDDIDGGSGDDTLDGGTGNDNLNGGSGDDDISGGKGDDVMIGGTGDDVLDWDDGDGSDTISGGVGNDTVEVDGSVTLGDNFVLEKDASNKAIFDRVGFDGQTTSGQFTLTVDTSETFDVRGDVGNDTFEIGDLAGTGVTNIKFSGGEGNDTLSADLLGLGTRIYAEGGNGDDALAGGADNDTLLGDDGNDDIEGEKGNDTMIGGLGDDTLGWDDGDGSDVMSGNDGNDTIEVEGAIAKADSFVLKNLNGNAFFERVALDGVAGQGNFTLTVDTSEIFDVSGVGGDDSFQVLDLAGTGVNIVNFSGGDGNDWLDGSSTSTPLVGLGDAGNDTLLGGSGNDSLTGGDGDDLLVGGLGIDTLTGGAGADSFKFANAPFANGAPTGTDDLLDYTIGTDKLVFDKAQLGLDNLKFLSGSVGNLSGDSNLLILTGQTFVNAAAAAQAIAANNNLSADEGLFVYFNSTLGIARVVFSQDLGDNGPISVLGNMRNQTDVGNLTQFAQTDFVLV